MQMSLSKNQKIATIGTLSALGLVGTFMLLRKSKIVRTASKFLGQKENYQNLSFQDEKFQYLMIRIARWYSGAAWCMFFVRLVYLLAYPRHAKEIYKMITPVTHSTFSNAKNDSTGRWQIETKPKPGDIFIIRKYVNGVAQYAGHGGLVSKVSKDYYTTIEGNSTEQETAIGDRVASRTRTYDFNVQNGMRLMGFIRFKG